MPTRSSARSLPPSRKALVWDWRSLALLSSRMDAASGPPRTLDLEQRFSSRYPPERMPSVDLGRLTCRIDCRRRYPHACGDAATLEDAWSAFRVICYAGGLFTA